MAKLNILYDTSSGQMLSTLNGRPVKLSDIEFTRRGDEHALTVTASGTDLLFLRRSSASSKVKIEADVEATTEDHVLDFFS